MLSVREQGKQAGAGRSWFALARFRNGIAVVVLAGGLVAAGSMPALAAPAAARAGITIAATSGFKPVTGDVFVVFSGGKFAKAHIHGSFSGAARGEVIRLLAQTFPFKTGYVRAGSRTLKGHAGAYSFTVTPSLATRYRVALYKSSKASTALAASTVRTVYVSNLMEPDFVTNPQKCSRPVCSQELRVTEVVPASTLRDEISKHWYFYFGLNLSPTTTPPPPTVLTLDTHATISKSGADGSTKFIRTIKWSFRVGNDGWNWIPNVCSKDTEAADGLGLPGHHGCGNARISATTEYLG
jgi:hypothetical protein